MTTDAKKISNDCIGAWNSHDVNKVVSFYTDDCFYEDLAFGIVNHGKKELTAFVNTSFVDMPDLKFEVKSVFGAGAWGVTEWVMSGTFAHSSLPAMPATGKTFSLRGASIVQFRGGKIARETDYYNLTTFLQQVGLMPAQPK